MTDRKCELCSTESDNPADFGYFENVFMCSNCYFKPNSFNNGFSYAEMQERLDTYDSNREWFILAFTRKETN